MPSAKGTGKNSLNAWSKAFDAMDKRQEEKVQTSLKNLEIETKKLKPESIESNEDLLALYLQVKLNSFNSDMRITKAYQPGLDKLRVEILRRMEK